MLKVESRDDVSVFEELRDWWNSQPGPRRSPFLRSEWFETWANTKLDANQRLFVLVARDASGPRAAIPLSKTRSHTKSLSDGTTEVFDLVHDGRDKQAVGTILERLRREPKVTLDRLDAESPLMDLLNSGTNWTVQRRVNSPFVDLSRGAEAVLDQLSSRRRHEFRRVGRRLDKAGDVEMQWSVPYEGVSGTLQEAFELEAKGWKGGAGVAVLSNPDKQKFFSSFAEVALKERWLRLSTLTLDGRMIAFQYDIEYESAIYGVLKTYDETFRNLSLGSTLFSMAMTAAAERGIDRYYMGGDDTSEWKAAWMSDTLPRVDLSGFGSSFRGVLLKNASAARRRLRSGPKTT